MRTGINLLLWTGMPSEDHVQLIEQAAKWGFNGVEIPIHHYNEKIYKAYRAKLDALGLGCTSTTVMPPAANPISPDAAVRAKGLEHLKRSLEMCGILGCEVMAGPMYSPVGAITGKARTDDEWKWGVEALSQAAKTAEAIGVDMAVEPLNRFETYFLNTLADACQLAREVGSPRMKVMIDTFHTNIEEKDLYAAYKSTAGLVAHVHISENDRGVPGTGHINYPLLFKALKEMKYDRWLVIESFSSTVPEIASAASIWRAVSPSKEAVAVEGLAFVKKAWAEA
jgi:D-psicose/D-tagatose/L-ribulose 3-epimerase